MYSQGTICCQRTSECSRRLGGRPASFQGGYESNCMSIRLIGLIISFRQLMVLTSPGTLLFFPVNMQPWADVLNSHHYQWRSRRLSYPAVWSVVPWTRQRKIRDTFVLLYWTLQTTYMYTCNVNCLYTIFTPVVIQLLKFIIFNVHNHIHKNITLLYK